MIDIDRLSEAELYELNRRIVERLRFMQSVRTHVRMMEFKVGEQVEFDSGDGRLIEGVLVRHNRKTVSVVTASGTRWTVAPALLRRPASTADEDVDAHKRDTPLLEFGV